MPESKLDLEALERDYASIANVPLGGIGGRIVIAFPALRDRIRELEGEVEDLEEQKEVCYAEWEKDCSRALRWLADKFGFEWDIDGNPADHLYEHIAQSLAARDARMKREGAAEWLENAAREGGYYERSSEGMLEEAKQLREGKVWATK